MFTPVEILVSLDRLAEAEDRLQKLDDHILGAELPAEIHMLRAVISSKKRDFVAEICHRRKAARLHPDNAWAWQVLVERQLVLSMPRQALADIAEALTHLPNEPDLLIEQARALRISGRAQEATACLMEVSLDRHASASTITRLANEYRSARLYDMARATAESAIRVEPAFSWGHLTLAFTVLEQDGPVAGLGQFKCELERSPNNLEAIYQVSRLFRESGDAVRARDFLMQREIGIRADFRLFEELIVCLCQCEEFERARELVARRRDLALPGDDLLGPAIEIELCAGNAKDLGALVARAQDAPSSGAGAFARIVRAAHVLGDFEAVIKTNRAWIAQDPSRTLQSKIAIAEAEFKLGRQDRAMAILDDLSKALGDFADLFAATARLLRASGKLREAKLSLQDGLRKFPNHPQLFEQYVRLCIQTGEIGIAQQLLASMRDGSYFLSAEKALLEIEISLELRDLEASLYKIQQFIPRQAHHRAHYRELCVRAYLGALDLASVRTNLAAEISGTKSDRKLRRQSLNVSQSLMGQLLDEYKLDQDNVQRLIKAMKLPQNARTDCLFEQVRHSPDSTACAITTLIHLRHAGFFSPPVETGQSSIPKRIAQFWDSSDVPPDIATYMDSWRLNNDGWGYELFDTGKAEIFIRSVCPASVVAAYRRTRDATIRADIFRLAWLNHRGGFYVDADDVSTGPIREIMTRNSTLIVYQEDIGSIGNNFIGAVEGHPVVSTALAQATDAILRGDNDMVWLSTGPGMLSRVFTNWLVADADSRRAFHDEVIVLDRGESTKVCAPHCQAAYKLTPLHWSKGLFG